jgi:hypothetical protein
MGTAVGMYLYLSEKGEMSFTCHESKPLILPVPLGPGVYSASNRNEYKKHKNNKVYGE